MTSAHSPFVFRVDAIDTPLGFRIERTGGLERQPLGTFDGGYSSLAEHVAQLAERAKGSPLAEADEVSIRPIGQNPYGQCYDLQRDASGAWRALAR